MKLIKKLTLYLSMVLVTLLYVLREIYYLPTNSSSKILTLIYYSLQSYYTVVLLNDIILLNIGYSIWI